MSTTPATVQWPAGTTCSECGDPEPTDEVNAEPVCGDCYAELSEAGDGIALDMIAALLKGAKDWDADTVNAVADVVRSTGRTVDSEDGDGA